MSAAALGGLKVPQSVTAAATAAQVEAAAAIKTIKTTELALEQVTTAKATIQGVNSAAEAAAALAAKQQALAVLQAAPFQNPRAIGKAQEEIAQLDALAQNFTGKAAALQALDQAAAARNIELTGLKQVRADALAKAEALIPLKAFEEDRTGVAVRAIESDLLKLKAALDNAIASGLVQPAQPCVSDFSGLIVGVQDYVDDKAHKNDCNLCQLENKIERTQAAKTKVFDKVKELKALAALPNASSLQTASEQADYLLAKSIDQMSKTLDEKGETAGKMIGALICKKKDPPHEEVVIYGFSGSVRDQQREVTTKIARATAALAKSPGAPLLVQALQAANDLLPAAALVDGAANTALALAGSWAPPLTVIGGQMRSAGGATQSMAALDLIKGGNNPVGVCSAPKMIQQAYALGLEPVAMAEAWMGGGSNKDGELVVSCDTCMSNIGVQLCKACK